MNRRLPHVARAALVVSTLVLGGTLAGCGGDTDPTSADPTSTSTPSAEPTSTSPTFAPPSTSEPAEPTETPEPTETDTPDPTPSQEPSSEPPAPSPYDDAVARIDAAGAPVQRTRFATAGDVYCLLDSDFIPFSCELPEGGIPSPQECGDAPSQSIGRIEQAPGGFEAVCNSDTIREPGARRADVGTVVASGGAECLVEGDGVTCVSRSLGHGFVLRSDSYELF